VTERFDAAPVDSGGDFPATLARDRAGGVLPRDSGPKSPPAFGAVRRRPGCDPHLRRSRA